MFPDGKYGVKFVPRMSLKSQIEQKFATAVTNGHLIFTPTVMHHIKSGNMDFQVRLSTTLGKKPHGSGLSKVPLVRPDPFNPPDANLLVKELESRNLVLNKYAISKHHLLVVTKDYETQYSILNLKDLKIVEMLINEIREPNLLFFYNCGTASGASVLHKHVQMLRCLETGIPIAKLISSHTMKNGEYFELDGFDFMHLCVKYNSFTAEKVQQHVKNLLKNLMDKIKPLYFEEYLQLPKDLQIEPLEFISYNLIMTADWLIIIPRKFERWNGMGLNSVAFAGFIFAKTEQDLDLLIKKTPIKVLEEICFDR